MRSDLMRPWLAHYPKEIPHHIDFAEKPLHNFLIESGERYEGMEALSFMGKTMTFGDVLLEVKKFAHFLQKNGLKKGDRVASMLPNTPQAVIAYYGALLAGGIVVQINPLFKERELTHLLTDSGATHIVCLDILLPLVSKVRKHTELEHI